MSSHDPIGAPEIEMRSYDADLNVVREGLSQKATLVGKAVLKRAVMDVHPPSPDRWIRVRTDGSKTTLAVKERTSNDVDGTNEVETTVSDFEGLLQVLSAMGVAEPRSFQENLREEYDLHGTFISIDRWPHIGELVEIEASSEAAIVEAATEIGLDPQTLTTKPVEKYYEEELGIDVKVTHLKLDV